MFNRERAHDGAQKEAPALVIRKSVDSYERRRGDISVDTQTCLLLGRDDGPRSTLMHLTPGSAFQAVPSNLPRVTVNRCESSTSY